MSITMKRRLMWASMIVGWLAFCWLRYHTANARIEECGELPMNYTQSSLCVRHAVESRDFVLVWGFTAPLLLLMAVTFVTEIARINRVTKS